MTFQILAISTQKDISFRSAKCPQVFPKIGNQVKLDLDTSSNTLTENVYI